MLSRRDATHVVASSHQKTSFIFPADLDFVFENTYSG